MAAVAAYFNGSIRDEMLIAAICEKMGWDYWTYCAQPHWFLRLLARKFDIDAQQAKRADKVQ